jgi:hypothetical protein
MITPSIINKGYRVLVGTPHSDKKNYCIEDYISAIKSLSYKNIDVLIVDNSESRKNYKRFIKEGFKAIHIKPKNHSIQHILAESHEAIRKYAVANNYDYLLHLESDLIPPTNVIESLMLHNLPIVSAMYMINFGKDSHLMAQNMETFGNLRETINVENGNDLLMVDGTLKPTFHCGLGCILIHKKILKLFEFRHEKGVAMHPDSFFAFDIDALGIKKFIDTSVLCEHNNSEWIYS